MRATPSWLSETPYGGADRAGCLYGTALSLQGDHFSDGCLLSLNRHQHSVVGPPSLAGFVFLGLRSPNKARIARRKVSAFFRVELKQRKAEQIEGAAFV